MEREKTWKNINFKYSLPRRGPFHVSQSQSLKLSNANRTEMENGI